MSPCFRPFHLSLACFCLAACLLANSASAADTRADFLKIIDRPRVDPSAHIDSSTTSNDLVQCHFSFAAETNQRVPGLLLEKEKLSGKHPAVIIMHGTGGKKEDELPLLRRLAARDFVAVAIDGRYSGERSHAGHGSTEYQQAIVRAYHGNGEHPLFYDTVWDILRLVDYLQIRPDIDEKRIGLAGISKGGIETYLAAAVDPRIAAAVPFIGMQDFHWALEHNDWQGRIGTIQDAFDTITREAGVTKADSSFVQAFYDRVVPGIYSEFDGPAMVKLISPRPLLVVNSDSDNHTPLPGVQNCADAARANYQAAGVPEQFSFIIQKNTGHQVNRASEDAMLEWFSRWLAQPK